MLVQTLSDSKLIERVPNDKLLQSDPVCHKRGILLREQSIAYDDQGGTSDRNSGREDGKRLSLSMYCDVGISRL